MNDFNEQICSLLHAGIIISKFFIELISIS